MSKLLTKLPRVDRYEVFRMKANARGWYWRLRSANGELVAGPIEPFRSSGNAWRACRTVARINRAGSTIRGSHEDGSPMGFVPIFVEVASDTWIEVSPA